VFVPGVAAEAVGAAANYSRPRVTTA